MKFYRNFFPVIILSLSSLMLTTSSWAVVILESTFKEFGFKKAEELAFSSKFSSLIFLEAESGTGSGAWIGNYEGHGYVLTAGHLFPPGTKVSDYRYYTMDGEEYKGESVYIHPLWNENFAQRTGYDFAIVRLAKEITNVKAQPMLYQGNAEQGKMLTFMGYGYRGMGNKGEDTSIDTEYRPAAAEGLIEANIEAVKPVPKKGDAGNYLGVWLPKEDGSFSNPLDENGITKPVSLLSGILGSGDSGGPAWIQTNSGWSIAGVNSNGTGNAAYGESSWFARVSLVREWILKIVPTAQFTS